MAVGFGELKTEMESMRGGLNTLRWQMGIIMVAVVGFGGSVSAQEILLVSFSGLNSCSLNMSFVAPGAFYKGCRDLPAVAAAAAAAATTTTTTIGRLSFPRSSSTVTVCPLNAA